MKTIHIIINDESGNSETEYQLFDFIKVLKIPFIQVKNSDQFEELIQYLSDTLNVFVWVHPNVGQRRDTGNITPGEGAVNYLSSKKNIDFEIISRYPDHVSKNLLIKAGKDIVDCNDIMTVIENGKPQSIVSIRAALNIENNKNKSKKMEEEKSQSNQPKITVGDNFSGVFTVGDENKIKNKVTIKKKVKQLSNELKNNNVPQADIDKLLKILELDKPDFEKKILGKETNNWIQKMIEKSRDGSWQIATATAGGLLTALLKGFFGM